MSRVDDAYARVRRNELAKQGHCINGISHPKPTRGTKCEWCYAVHRLGLTEARKQAADDESKPQPPGKR